MLSKLRANKVSCTIVLLCIKLSFDSTVIGTFQAVIEIIKFNRSKARDEEEEAKGPAGRLVLEIYFMCLGSNGRRRLSPRQVSVFMPRAIS